jgi:hypothetical protein
VPGDPGEVLVRGGGEYGQQRAGDEGQDQAAGEQRQDNAVFGQRPADSVLALLAPRGPLLAVVRLHVTIEFPRVIGNLDVDRWQASFVPFRFAAWVHSYLSDRSEHLLSVWASGGGHKPAPSDLNHPAPWPEEPRRAAGV